MGPGGGLRSKHAHHRRLGSTPSLTVMLCSMVAAIRAALFLAWSAIVPLKSRRRSSERERPSDRTRWPLMARVSRAPDGRTNGVLLNVAVLKSTDSQKSYILGRWVGQST